MRQIITILLGIGFIYYLLFHTETGTRIRPQVMEDLPKLSKRVVPFIQPVAEPTPVPLLTAANFFEALNVTRRQAKLPLLQENESLCPLATTLLQNQQLQTRVIERNCPLCTKVLSVIFDERVGTQSAVERILESSMSAIVDSSQIRQTCVGAADGQVALVAAVLKKPDPTPKPPRLISEDELWEALTSYRQSQNRTRLERDEQLCTYARKRVDDHIRLLDSHLPKAEYPVPDKYPLDAHAGFSKDAESGYVFDATGRSVVAENLAYWPNAEYAVHVIEWGWDTSTEGHRETQLSNDFTVACLTGKQGFYVGIFGK